jgi:hypothetical protein
VPNFFSATATIMQIKKATTRKRQKGNHKTTTRNTAQPLTEKGYSLPLNKQELTKK